MTASRHRSAAITLQTRYRLASSGQMDPVTSPHWGYEIWPALAAEHLRRSQKIDFSLARTAEVEAVVEAAFPT